MATIWNTSNATSGIAFSNGNLTASGNASGNQSCVSTTSKSGGKVYFELTLNAVTNDISVGISNSNYNFQTNSGLGGDTNSSGVGYYSVSPIGQAFFNGIDLSSTGNGKVAASNGTVVSIALDLANLLFWVTSTQMRADWGASAWNNNTNSNPANGTGGYSFSGMALPCFITFNNSESGGVVTLNTGATSFTQTMPSGFTAWDSSGATPTPTPTPPTPTPTPTPPTPTPTPTPTPPTPTPTPTPLSGTTTYNIHVGLSAWAGNTNYTIGNRVSSNGYAWQALNTGVSGTSAPSGTSNVSDGQINWKWLSKIDYGGSNGASAFSAATNALPATFTSNIIWQIWNNGPITTSAGTAFLALSGHNTNGGYLRITPAPGESFRDSLKTNNTLPLSANASNGVLFQLPSGTGNVNYFDISDVNVQFVGLQFVDPNSTSNCTIIQTETSGSSFLLRSCIVDGYAQANGALILAFNAAANIQNCLVIDRQAANGNNIAIATDTTGVVFINNTFVAINAGITVATIAVNYNAANSTTIKNCWAAGYTLGIAANGANSSASVVSYCATDASSPTIAGSNALTGQSAATTFTSFANYNKSSYYVDCYLLNGASAIGTATTDTTNLSTSDDILGNTRTGNWDIGAVRYFVQSQSTQAQTWSYIPQYPLYDTAGNAYVIGNFQGTNPQVLANGVLDTTTSNVSQLLYYDQKMYYQNSSGLWYVKANFASSWVQVSADPRTVFPIPFSIPDINMIQLRM